MIRCYVMQIKNPNRQILPPKEETTTNINENINKNINENINENNSAKKKKKHMKEQKVHHYMESAYTWQNKLLRKISYFVLFRKLLNSTVRQQKGWVHTTYSIYTLSLWHSNFEYFVEELDREVYHDNEKPPIPDSEPTRYEVVKLTKRIEICIFSEEYLKFIFLICVL